MRVSTTIFFVFTFLTLSCVNTSEAPLFQLIVEGGTGSGTYSEGSKLTIEALASEFTKEFAYWAGDTFAIADVNEEKTFLIMPAENISIEAVFKDLVTSYSLDIAPLFVQYCTTHPGCHLTNDGGSGISLLTYEEQVAGAPEIKKAISFGSMPLTGSMPQEEINLIIAWIDAGTPNN